MPEAKIRNVLEMPSPPTFTNITFASQTIQPDKLLNESNNHVIL